MLMMHLGSQFAGSKEAARRGPLYPGTGIRYETQRMHLPDTGRVRGRNWNLGARDSGQGVQMMHLRGMERVN